MYTKGYFVFTLYDFLTNQQTLAIIGVVFGNLGTLVQREDRQMSVGPV